MRRCSSSIPAGSQIAITERVPFALWQKDGKINVISADGTVLAPLTERRFVALPLVVGRGAETQGERLPGHCSIAIRAIRNEVRASILVAERRWNLRLKNGIDVRLPEPDPEVGARHAGRARPRQAIC